MNIISIIFKTVGPFGIKTERRIAGLHKLRICRFINQRVRPRILECGAGLDVWSVPQVAKFFIFKLRFFNQGR